jgi:hypothetical protein
MRGGFNDAHAEEYLRRVLAELLQNGQAKLVVESYTNMTGSKTKVVQTGKYLLTDAGMKQPTADNKAALENPTEEPPLVHSSLRPQAKQYQPLR